MEFTVIIYLGDTKPMGKQSHRTARGVTYIPKKTRDFQRIILAEFRRQNKGFVKIPKGVPIMMQICAHFEMPKSWSNKKKAKLLDKYMTSKPDYDNIAKIVGDTLKGVAYEDDAQLMGTVTKYWSKENVLIIRGDVQGVEGGEVKKMSSYEAYRYCRDVNDDPEVRHMITESWPAYLYCVFVKDRPEIRKLITDSWDAYLYCLDVKDRSSVRNLITDSYDAYLYCRYVNDDPEVRKFITNPSHLCDYNRIET